MKQWDWIIHSCYNIKLKLLHGFVITFNKKQGMWILIYVQMRAIIMWSNITWYHTNHCGEWDRIWMQVWTHKRCPIPHPNGQAMGCLSDDFGENLPNCNVTAQYQSLLNHTSTRLVQTEIHYIPRNLNMLSFLLCFTKVRYWLLLFMFFFQNNLSMGQLYNFPSVSDTTLENIGTLVTWIKEL